MTVEMLPIPGKPSGHLSQKMRSQMRDFDPVENQEPGIVGQKVQIVLTFSGRPADKAVPATDVPGSRRPGQTGNRPLPGKYHIFEMFSHGLNVTEVMKLSDKTVVEFLKGGAPDLMNNNGAKLSKIGFDRTLVDLDPLRFFAIPGAAVDISPSGGQLDEAFGLKTQQESAADHVFGMAVGLDPPPGLADLLGKSGPVGIRMGLDQIPDKVDVFPGDGTVSMDKNRFHV